MTRPESIMVMPGDGAEDMKIADMAKLSNMDWTFGRRMSLAIGVADSYPTRSSRSSQRF